MIKTLTPKDRRVFDAKILINDPLCLNLFTETRQQYCNHCVKQIQTFRCTICKQMYYCSNQCQKADWDQHKLECKYLKNMKANLPPQMLLTIRVYLSKISLKDFYGSVDDIDIDKRQQYQDIAILIAHHIQEENVNTLEALLLIQIQIQFNVFTIRSNLGEPIGIGLYTPANFYDHRCQRTDQKQQDVANCSHFNRGRQLIIQPNDLYTGGEATISYTNILDYNNRKAFLMENYGFECNCDRCQMESKTGVSQQVNTLETQYLELLSKEDYKNAFKYLKKHIKQMTTELCDSKHPYIGFKLNEASKLAFHLNYLIKGEDLSRQALSILKTYFSDTQEYQDLLQRYSDIQKEILMSK